MFSLVTMPFAGAINILREPRKGNRTFHSTFELLICDTGRILKTGGNAHFGIGEIEKTRARC